MLCLVLNGSELPHCSQFVNRITEQFPELSSIMLNINRERTNVILGKKSRLIYGKDHITDTLCGSAV